MATDTRQAGLGAAGSERGFFGHPKGLQTLFFTEMWERFSYYGMRAILTLFMLAAVETGGLGFTKAESGPIYAMYTSFVYLMCIPGGWLADNVLGQRRSVLYGGITIMIGHIFLAIHGFGLVTFFAGLGFVIVGTGLLKPNISAVVGQLYSPEDRRRESGFSIFYMGINMGAFLAPLVCGYLAQDEGFRARLIGWGMDPKNAWHWGFGAAAVGMFLGLVQYVRTGRHLGEAGLHPSPARTPAETTSRKRMINIGLVTLGVLAAAVTLLAVRWPATLTKDNINLAYQILLALVVIFFFRNLFKGDWTRAERSRLTVIVILFSAAAVFWGVFEQAGSTLTIFADESTLNVAPVKGAFPSSWWQSLNAVLIVLIAPFFAWLWLRLGTRNPSYGTKFAIGLVFVGLGFLWLVFGARIFTNDWTQYVQSNRPAIIQAAQDVKAEVTRNPKIGEDPDDVKVPAATGQIQVSDVSAILAKAKDHQVDVVLPPWQRVGVYWLFVVYLLHTIGELFLSPVGLAAMTKLAPTRVVGQMMGVWFLAASIGNYLGGSVSGYYERFELPTLLLMVAVSAFVMAGIMFVLVKPMNRMLGADQQAGH